MIPLPQTSDYITFQSGTILSGGGGRVLEERRGSSWTHWVLSSHTQPHGEGVAREEELCGVARQTPGEGGGGGVQEISGDREVVGVARGRTLHLQCH